jgi:hypothetical protein
MDTFSPPEDAVVALVWLHIKLKDDVLLQWQGELLEITDQIALSSRQQIFSRLALAAFNR